MFELKLNTGKNAILCMLDGRFEAEEARRYVEKFKSGIDQLEPGMIVISDLSKFTPTDEEVREILHEGSTYAVEKGISRAIRIVTEEVGSKIGNVQLNRTARELGYKAEIVGSLEEAKELLGW